VRVGLIGNSRGWARPLATAGFEVAAHAAGTGNRDGLDHPRAEAVDGFARLREALAHPRLFFLDLPGGASLDAVLDEAYLVMEPGDAVLDTSGAYWGDTLRRYRRMRHRALFYVDAALLGELPGGTVLAAGDARALALVEPVLERLARPGGAVVRAGGAGAAHYALMVHEAVATATSHALGEARQLLEAYPNAPEAAAVLEGLWPNAPAPGSRAAWLLDDAVRLQAAVPLLAQGVMLEIAQALDEQRPAEVPERVQGFVHPDEIL
jgi:6-phosphogluconate dehydrogenase